MNKVYFYQLAASITNTPVFVPERSKVIGEIDYLGIRMYLTLTHKTNNTILNFMDIETGLRAAFVDATNLPVNYITDSDRWNNSAAFFDLWCKVLPGLERREDFKKIYTENIAFKWYKDGFRNPCTFFNDNQHKVLTKFIESNITEAFEIECTAVKHNILTEPEDFSKVSNYVSYDYSRALYSMSFTPLAEVIITSLNERVLNMFIGYEGVLFSEAGSGKVAQPIENKVRKGEKYNLWIL